MEGIETRDYEKYFQSFLEPGESMIIVFVTRLEQDLFLELLSRNRKRISSEFKPPPSDKRLKLSFFLPITGLTG